MPFGSEAHPLLRIAGRQKHGYGYSASGTRNRLYNIGFMRIVTWVMQVITGLLLTRHYTAEPWVIDGAHPWYSPLYGIERNVYFGWLLHVVHATGSGLFFLLYYLHRWRALLVGSGNGRGLTVITGNVRLLVSRFVAFLGYSIVWGNLARWAIKVIRKLVRWVPHFKHFIIGHIGLYGDRRLARFFVLHFVLPFVVGALIVVHILVLHSIGGSSYPGVQAGNLSVSFFPSVLVADMVGLVRIWLWYISAVLGTMGLIHPDNMQQTSVRKAPAHIVPEWYFLPQFAVLKVIPRKPVSLLAFLISAAFLLFRSLPSPLVHFIPGYLIVLGRVGLKPRVKVRWLRMGRFACYHILLLALRVIVDPAMLRAGVGVLFSRVPGGEELYSYPGMAPHRLGLTRSLSAPSFLSSPSGPSSSPSGSSTELSPPSSEGLTLPLP